MNYDSWHAVPSDITAIMQFVDTFVQWERNSGEQRTYLQYHPSAFGRCLRTMQYQRYVSMGFIPVVEEKVDSRMLRLWGKGHNMHSRWVSYFDNAGVLRGNWQCANPFCGKKFRQGEGETLGIFRPKKCDECNCKDFIYKELPVKSKELNMFGHADMVLDFSNFSENFFDGTPISFKFEDLPKTPIVIDMKTAKNSSFLKVLKNGPDMYYQIQLTIYINLLGCESGLLIYEDKDDSRTASYKIEKNTDTMFKTISVQAKLMNEMAKSKLLPPPRPDKKDSYECRYCNFSTICKKSAIWKNSNLKEIREKFYGNLI